MTPLQSPQGPTLSTTPLKVVRLVSKRRSAPSIGLPSCYPASPTMIAFEKEASKESRTDSLVLLQEQDTLSLFSSLMDQDDSVSSCDTNQQQQQHPLNNSSSDSCTSQSTQQKRSSHRRRQRNRALSDVDFASIMDDFSTLVV
ncbi:unnamed protein product [Cylindrotheca closterium]|uniref:Uncharacterized protein n=1 Tax=Cylindrotheca closterium TaxID=2856 RepID=A0AAD2JJ71_9STRA|nr:unnamed protein product [Cylindrotheca closterium]